MTLSVTRTLPCAMRVICPRAHSILPFPAKARCRGSHASGAAPPAHRRAGQSGFHGERVPPAARSVLIAEHAARRGNPPTSWSCAPARSARLQCAASACFSVAISQLRSIRIFFTGGKQHPARPATDSPGHRIPQARRRISGGGLCRQERGRAAGLNRPGTTAENLFTAGGCARPVATRFCRSRSATLRPSG